MGPWGTTNGLTAEVTCSMAVRSRTAVAAAVATAGSARSTPVSVRGSVLKPAAPPCASRSRPPWFSPSTVISPLPSRSNRLGVPAAPDATAKPATTKTTQNTTTARARRATTAPQRRRSGWGPGSCEVMGTKPATARQGDPARDLVLESRCPGAVAVPRWGDGGDEDETSTHGRRARAAARLVRPAAGHRADEVRGALRRGRPPGAAADVAPHDGG